MFQPDWPTDAPVPTGAPVAVDPLVDNCRLLVECVNKMSLYDLFVLYHSDDIDPDDGTLNILEDDPDDSDDDPFATFRTFDESEVEVKFEVVKSKAKDFIDELDEQKQPFNLRNCSGLLQEFHRVVEFDEVNNWEGSSVSQVCFAEGTPVFVKLSEIAKVKTKDEQNDDGIKDTIGKKIATSVFRDFFACTTKLADGNGEENPFQKPGIRDAVRIPIGYDTSLTDKHGRPLPNTYPFEYRDLVRSLCLYPLPFLFLY
jgi:hypothetical protein